MKFYAFDSFSGFPKNDERDSVGRKCFQEGLYASSEQEFLRNVRRTGADMKRTVAVPGWFEDFLRSENPLIQDLSKAAVVWVDCVLYSSTRTVLDFLTPYLQYGTLMLFGDWFAFLGDPNAGQERAFGEWLEARPKFSAVEFSHFGSSGNSFIVHKAQGDNPTQSVAACRI